MCIRDRFNVRSLGGIESCRNLKKINVISMLDCNDLDPIGKLQNLEVLELSGNEEWKNLPCLLELPRLREFRFFSSEISHSEEWVLEELLKKGVDARPYE